MFFTRNEKFWEVGCGIINLPMLLLIEVETKITIFMTINILAWVERQNLEATCSLPK